MDSNEIRKKLSSLTDREREVLGYFCQEIHYIDIGYEVGLSEGTIKSHMYHVFHKLGIGEYSKGERRQILLEKFCPVLKNETLDVPPPEQGSSEPLSEEEEEIIDQLQYPLVVIDTEDLVPTPVDPPRRSCLPLFFRNLLGVILVAVVVVGLFKGRDFFTNREAEETIPIETQVAQALAATFENQTEEPIKPTDIEESPTFQEEPTLTMSLPTNTLVPTITSSPQPVIILPFSDNFENGPSPNWTVLNGTWLTSNGTYTTLNTKSDWVWSLLDEPAWENYRIKVDVEITSYATGQQSFVAIAVRTSRSLSEFLGFYSDYFVKGCWGFLGQDIFALNMLACNEERYSVPEKATWELEVIGNQFIACINGREYQRITLPGYDRGGVALGVICRTNSGCPSFDNFSIEPIN